MLSTYELKEESTLTIIVSGRYYTLNKKGDMIIKDGNIVKMISDYSDTCWIIPINKIEACDVKSASSLERNKMCIFLKELFA